MKLAFRISSRYNINECMIQCVIVLCKNEQKSFEYCLKASQKILKIEKREIDHPDLIVISGSSSIGIDQAKEVINKMKRHPYQSGYIISIIHPGDLLTTEAQNALLKLIEEPPKYARIFITATHRSHLLPTIRSRCKIHYIECYQTQKNVNNIDLHSLISKPIAQRLEYIDKITQKKEINQIQIKQMLDDLLLNISPTSNPALFKRIIKAKEMLLKNVTPQHVLDYIALSNYAKSQTIKKRTKST